MTACTCVSEHCVADIFSHQFYRDNINSNVIIKIPNEKCDLHNEIYFSFLQQVCVIII